MLFIEPVSISYRKAIIKSFFRDLIIAVIVLALFIILYFFKRNITTDGLFIAGIIAFCVVVLSSVNTIISKRKTLKSIEINPEDQKIKLIITKFDSVNEQHIDFSHCKMKIAIDLFQVSKYTTNYILKIYEEDKLVFKQRENEIWTVSVFVKIAGYFAEKNAISFHFDFKYASPEIPLKYYPDNSHFRID